MKKKTLLLSLLLLLLVDAGASSARPADEGLMLDFTAEADADSYMMLPKVQNSYSSTLSTVLSRGRLLCGINQNLPGFGSWDGQSYSGFDWDFCRALAAAVLGDAADVEAVPLSASQRFPSLQSGAVDVLIRNTTRTLSRDAALLLNFAPTTFYDGQGIMAHASSGVNHLADFAGKVFCVQAGTTTEENLIWALAEQGIDADVLRYPDIIEAMNAYFSSACDGFTSDKTWLLSVLITSANPTSHIILEDTLSKEPLGPVVRHLDDNWFDIVSWTVYCTVAAEEYGVNSGNVDDFLGDYDRNISPLLGAWGDLGQYLGLGNDFCYQVIKQVGNYAEIYDRNLGPGSDFNLPRGFNRQYYQGGLLYAPPFR